VGHWTEETDADNITDMAIRRLQKAGWVENFIIITEQVEQADTLFSIQTATLGISPSTAD